MNILLVILIIVIKPVIRRLVKRFLIKVLYTIYASHEKIINSLFIPSYWIKCLISGKEQAGSFGR